MHEIKATILRRKWRIVPAPGLGEIYGNDGECDPPRAKNKAIRYDPGIGFWDLMETIGHEAHHAALPSTDHDDLTDFHHDIRRIQEAVAEQRWVILEREEYEQLLKRSETAYGNLDTARDGATEGVRDGGEELAGDCQGDGSVG